VVSQPVVYETESETPAYTYNYGSWPEPQIDLNVPDFTWNPTEAMKSGWQTTAENRIALKYDPIRQQVAQNLARFGTAAAGEEAKARTQNTIQQLNFANTVKNARQALIDAAVRRGAETSGWLPNALMGLGQYEAGQREQMGQTFADVINNLAAQKLQKETEAADELTSLTGLSGSELLTILDELEARDRANRMAELQSTWGAQYDKAALINQVAAAQKQAQYNDALLQAQLAQQQWERGASERSFALEQQLANYQMRPRVSTGSTTPTIYVPGYGNLPADIAWRYMPQEQSELDKALGMIATMISGSMNK
jgi:hypothetical protein